jgi:hypothetical protein
VFAFRKGKKGAFSGAPRRVPKLSTISSKGASPLSGGDDQVIELAHRTYDAAGNVTEQFRLEANHDDTDGLDATNHDDFVQTAVYSWYDAVGRLTATADYGANASTWSYAAAAANLRLLEGYAGRSTGDTR